MGKYDKYIDDVIKLHKAGDMNRDISKKIGIDARRVSDLLSEKGLKANKRPFNDRPNKHEEKIFVSMFIGDGCIFKSKGNKNYRVNLAHGHRQKEYFLMKYNRVKNFVGVDYFKQSQLHKKTKKHYHAYKFQSKVNPYFTRAREIWYRDGKKIIPKEIYKHLDWELMAYKFFDDGNLMPHGYSISMNDYDLESVNTLMDAMKKNLGLESNLHASGPSIYIPSKERGKFKKNVQPYATKDVLYKLGELSETPNE